VKPERTDTPEVLVKWDEDIHESAGELLVTINQEEPTTLHVRAKPVMPIYSRPATVHVVQSGSPRNVAAIGQAPIKDTIESLIGRPGMTEGQVKRMVVLLQREVVYGLPNILREVKPGIILKVCYGSGLDSTESPV
jgi:hypothetical protein